MAPTCLGAGAGAALVLGLMFVVHPFLLVPVLLLPLAAATLFGPGRRAGLAGVLALAACEAVLLTWGRSRPITTSRRSTRRCTCRTASMLAQVTSPRGLYVLLDDFTERVDTDVSNDLGLLKVPGPPQTYGLYRDGNRVAALPKPGLADVGYAPATLAAFPYLLRPHPRVLARRLVRRVPRAGGAGAGRAAGGRAGAGSGRARGVAAGPGRLATACGGSADPAVGR